MPASQPQSSGSGESLASSAFITQTAHGFVVGDWIRINSSGAWVKAQATTTAGGRVIGMVSAVNGANQFKVTTDGVVSGLTGLTAGSVYYLSASNAGEMTTISPNTFSRPLFTALSTTSGYVFEEKGGTSEKTLSYLSLLKATATTIAGGGSDVIFDSVQNTIGTGITYNSLTGVVTLEAGKTYRLRAMLSNVSSSTGNNYQFVTPANVALVPNIGNANAGPGASDAGLDVLYTAAVATQFKVRASSSTGGNNYGANMQWLTVEQIPSTEVVPAGTIVPKALSFAHWSTDGLVAGFNIPAVGSPILFTGTRIGSRALIGTGASLNTTTGLFQLEPGTYRLSAQIMNASSASIQLATQWKNVTTNTFVGAPGQNPGLSVGETGLSSTEAIVTVATATEFAPYVVQRTSGAYNIGGNDFRVTQIIIEELPVATVVDPGLIVPTPLSHLSVMKSTTTPNAGVATDVAFDVVLASLGTGIAYVPATGVATLTAGKTYRIATMLRQDSNTTIGFYFVADATTNVALNGLIGSASSHPAFGDNSIEFIYTPVANQSIKVRRQANSGANTANGQWFTIEELPTSTVVDPGMLVPDTLHVVSIATTTPDVNAVATVLTESGVGGYFVPNLSDPALTKFDPNTMISGNKVVIKQAGRYRLAAGARLTSATPEPGIRVNGIYVATGDHFGATELLHYECVRLLNVGDIVDFCVYPSALTAQANGFYMMVEQLPAYSVSYIPADAIPASTITKVVGTFVTGDIGSGTGATTVTGDILTATKSSGGTSSTYVLTHPPIPLTAVVQMTIQNTGNVNLTNDQTQPVFTRDSTTQTTVFFEETGAVVQAGVVHVAMFTDLPTSTHVLIPPGYTNTNALSAISAKKSTSTVGAIGTDIVFDQIAHNSGGGITYNAGTGIFTLGPAGRYQITVTGRINAIAGYVEFSVVDTSNNVIGASGSSSSGTGMPGESPVHFIHEAAAGAQIKVRIIGLSGTPALFGGTQSITIVQLPTTEMVTPGDVVPTPLSILDATRVAAQTASLLAGSRVEFTNVSNLTGTSITIDGAPNTGRITLQPGLYQLTADIGSVSTPTSDTRSAFQWYNVTSGAYIGSIQSMKAPADSAANASSGGVAEAILSVVVPTQVEFRCRSVQGGTMNGWGGDSDPGVTIYPSARVVQLPESTVVDPGLITPTPLHRARLTRNTSATIDPADGVTLAPWQTSGPGNVGMTVDGTAGTITATQAGTYRVYGSGFIRTYTGGVDQALGIYVDGVLAITGGRHDNGDDNDMSLMDVLGFVDLTPGQVVTLRFVVETATTFSPSHFVVEQVPTSTVVDPGLTPVATSIAAAAPSDALSVGAFNAKVLTKQATVALGALSSGNDTPFVTVSMPGAAVGDIVVVTETASGWTMRGFVSAANTVSVSLSVNQTGVSGGAGNWAISILVVKLTA